MLSAPVCICGKHMLERANEGTCVWCGHGIPHAVVELAYRRNMERAPVRAPRPEAPVIATLRARRWTAEACVQAARDWERIYGRLPRSQDWTEADDGRVERPTYHTVWRVFGGWNAFRREIADVPREQLAA